VRRRTLARTFIASAGMMAVAWAATNGAATAAGQRTTLVKGPKFTTVPYRTLGAPAGRSSPGTVGANVNITHRTGAQSETTIAVDPMNKTHILAASNDLSGSLSTKVYESLDKGHTWAVTFDTSPNFCYDPWLDFNSAGDMFFAYECSDQRIAYRKHGTSNWVSTVLVGSSLFPDRDQVNVDTTAGSPFKGSVYVGYDEANAGNAAHLMYSRDGFGGWAKSPKINDTSATIGVNAATAPNGTVYATWLDYNGKKISVDKSTDGGATWGTDHTVTNMRLPTQNFFIFIPPQPDRGIVPMPFTDTAPAGTAFAGRLYAAYEDKDPTTADTNIYVRHSDDGGTTWSAEVKVNDDSVHAYQFFPAISVSANGTVGVSFYDTRNDQPSNHKTDQFIAFSTNGGDAWSVNQKVTTAQSDESGAGDRNDYGDYEGNDAFGAAKWRVVWTDSRPGNLAEDMYEAKARP